MVEKCKWVSSAVQVGEIDEGLDEHSFFEYAHGLDLKAFSCLQRFLDETLSFRDFRALL